MRSIIFKQMQNYVPFAQCTKSPLSPLYQRGTGGLLMLQTLIRIGTNIWQEFLLVIPVLDLEFDY